MSLTHGMNVETIRLLAKSFDAQATTVQQLETRVNQLVAQAERYWTGPDSRQFVGEWNNTHRKAILTIIAALTELAKVLARNAQVQQESSDTYDGVEGVTKAPSHGGTPPETGRTEHESPLHIPSQTPNDSSPKNLATSKFVDTYNGTLIDYDKAYQAQCFDVFQQYSHTVAGVPASVSIATSSMRASDIYHLYESNGVANYYDRIPYGQGLPEPGDIVVYNHGGTWGEYGHVGLITGVGPSSYSVMEQNYTSVNNPGFQGLIPAAINEKAFAPGILGYLRPKQSTTHF